LTHKEWIKRKKFREKIWKKNSSMIEMKIEDLKDMLDLILEK